MSRAPLIKLLTDAALAGDAPPSARQRQAALTAARAYDPAQLAVPLSPSPRVFSVRPAVGDDAGHELLRCGRVVATFVDGDMADRAAASMNATNGLVTAALEEGALTRAIDFLHGFDRAAPETVLLKTLIEE